jgi:hypothetical protein
MMHDMMEGRMMWGMGLLGIIVFVVLMLILVALVKYIVRR